MALTAPWHMKKRSTVWVVLPTLGPGYLPREYTKCLWGTGEKCPAGFQARTDMMRCCQAPSQSSVPFFSSQISAILYPVPDVLSQLPSPTWFRSIILSIKKLVIKMKHPLPILLPAFTLLHLPIPSTLLIFKRLISMWSCLCQDSPVPSAPFLDDQSHPDHCSPYSKIQHIF